jgi:hypothetical protein
MVTIPFFESEMLTPTPVTVFIPEEKSALRETVQ